MAVLVFRDEIVEFLGDPKTVEKTVQDTTPEKPEVPPPVPVVVPMEKESIPFAPLPDVPPSAPQREVVKQATPEAKISPKGPPEVEEKKPVKLSESFGLICTKFERIPSRFRLVSWEGTKKVEIEDLHKIDSSTKKHPRFWLELRVPYKEFMHPTTKESFFRPTILKDPNKRMIAQSFEIKNEALSYSGRVNPIGYLIMKDFKIGGPPYQLTSEMDQPLTSSYFVHFEQDMGPKKFFHDLTGQRNGYKFGGWGYEYKIIKQNFAQNKITVLRKDLKSGRVTEKELSGPTPL